MAKKIRRQPNLEKAIDQAIWLNFAYRLEKTTFGVVQSVKGDYLIIDTDHPTFKDEPFETLPADYSNMDYNHIRHIRMQEEPLMHWEEIVGAIVTMPGELLRFILKYNVPLEKFIRLELANRGHDEDHKWIGFKKAEEIWLN